MNFKNNKKVVNFSFYFLEIFGLVILCLLSYLLYLFLSFFFGFTGSFGVSKPSKEYKILNNSFLFLEKEKQELLKKKNKSYNKSYENTGSQIPYATMPMGFV